MSERIAQLVKNRLAIAEDIFTHESQIANIELQISRVDEGEADKEWLAKANYALSMKRAELGKLQEQLESLKIALGVMGEEDSEDQSMNQEIIEAAKRRLDPEVFASLMDEAREIVEDRMYDVVEHVRPASSS